MARTATASAQIPLVLPFREAMEEEDFIPTPGNRAACELVVRPPAVWNAPCAALAGPPGSGKTHLLRLWAKRNGAALLAPEELRAGGEALLADRGPLLALDDASVAAGDAALEQGLFHLHNAVKTARGALLLAAAEPPARWGVRLPDLASRLNAAFVATIAPPEDSLLEHLLMKLLRDRQLGFGESLIPYLLARTGRSCAAIRAVVDRLDREAFRRQRRALTPRLAAAALREDG